VIARFYETKTTPAGSIAGSNITDNSTDAPAADMEPGLPDDFKIGIAMSICLLTGLLQVSRRNAAYVIFLKTIVQTM